MTVTAAKVTWAPWVVKALLIGTFFMATPAWAVSDCVYGGTNFSDGAVACQSGYQFRCSNGTWEPLDLSCLDNPPAPTRSQPAACACSEEDQANCNATGEICCVSLEGDTCVKRCCERP
jgi:hypothetical protein